MGKTTDCNGRFQYPANWNRVTREINKMFKEVNPTYLRSSFITVSFYTIPLEVNPEMYPLLMLNSKATRHRYIALFLRDKGWIRHSVHSFMNPKLSQVKGEKAHG